MIWTDKQRTRAAGYRRLASAAATLAEASPLAHVREKQQLAAAQWTALARTVEAPIARGPAQ